MEMGPEGTKFCEILSHSVTYGKYVTGYHRHDHDNE